MRIDRNTDFERTDYENLKISDLKRMADYWLRKYLLSKAKRKGMSGYIYCPIKNTWYPEHKMHVAHFIDRGVMCTRYHLPNVNLISEQSNSWDSKVQKEGYKSKHHFEYEMWLGKNKVEKLLELSKGICIFTRRDYIELIEKFRDVG